ncbi:hypothetical protein F5X96DRAFT_656298 [Biscogniauxia mediterranea]|nr:hypothetical protein F5X96DRAFT_656298 [Biscogniauxia mediterranea]
MVSLWPWKGDDSSPASFERALSALSTKITTTQSRLERTRSNSRRIKVLWTLYLTFAYLVYSIVLMLVVGWQNLGPLECTGMAGGPVLIYLVRTLINSYFSFRIDTLETRLKDHQGERAKTIQKLKEATKYDSTLELLEKYGGSGEKRNEHSQQHAGDGEEGGEPKPGRKGRLSVSSHSQAGRTTLPPPPTANIQRPSSAPGTPSHQPSRQIPSLAVPPPRAPSPQQPTAEFAPNAGPVPASYSHYEMDMGPPRWYDRIMDLMLGEDETASKNRIVLICQRCRLVNGQAPPGTRSLADVGMWKCMACGSMNGEMDEGKKIVREVLGRRKAPGSETRGGEDQDSDRSSDLVKVEQVDEDETNGDSPPASVNEARARQWNKKSQMVP